MDVYTLARSCARRWFVFVPVLAISIAGAVLASGKSTIEYSSSATLLILGPNTTPPAPAAGQVAAVNPFAQSSSGDRSIASALTAELNADPTTELPQTAVGTAGTFTAILRTQQPVLTIISSAPTQASATDIVQQAIVRAQAALQKLQTDAGAPPGTLYMAQMVGKVTSVASSRQNATKALVGIGIAGLLFAVLLSAAVDGLVLRRKRVAGVPLEDMQDGSSAGAASGRPGTRSPAPAVHGGASRLPLEPGDPRGPRRTVVQPASASPRSAGPTSTARRPEPAGPAPARRVEPAGQPSARRAEPAGLSLPPSPRPPAAGVGMPSPARPADGPAALQRTPRSPHRAHPQPGRDGAAHLSAMTAEASSIASHRSSADAVALDRGNDPASS